METRKAKTRTVAMVVLCGILVYALIATGGSLEPSAPPGPTMKTLDEVEPRIPISSLPYTISTSGSYYITGDLTATGTGITVNADNVTIDLMGYSLIGPGSGANYGIYMSQRSNVEVRNGTVRDFSDYGIYEASTTAGKGHRFISVRAVSNGGHGICLSTSRGNLVKDCTAVENGAIGIRAGYGSTVTGNTAYYNQKHGIELGGQNLVDQNTAYLNNQSGGSYVNMDLTRTDCTYGVNHAP